ncbi:MAG TPA: COX15/CtaA family protein [Kofleriaceae bacterium]|nr:COX15/CtaA family protein [Kofleriaceae bacterium]
MLEYRFAKLAAGATFLLLLIGGTVNPTGSSLACPEPTLVCHGQFLPPMTGGVLYEHGHRLAAMTVGLLQIGLTILLWRRRRAMRGLGVAALVMVCAQGALGAITVAYKLPTAVSVAHLMVAFGYFATLIYIAWRVRPGAEISRYVGGHEVGSARRWVLAAGAVVAGQILLGALVRHTGAALACIDLPLCNGDLMPQGATLPLAVHMLHRMGGVIVGIVVIAASIALYRKTAGHRALRGLAIAAPIVVLAQITLGILTIYTLRDTPVAVAHFGGAAILWGIWVAAFLLTIPRTSQPRRAQRTNRLGRLVGDGV